MKIVIAGAGEVGTHLAKMLCDENHDITLIDRNKDKLKKVDANIDILTHCGSSISFKDLIEAGVDNCDLFIAVTHYEETNITSAILAKQIGAKKTVARIDNKEYLTQEHDSKIKALGIDFLIYPETLAAKEVLTVLKQPATRMAYQLSSGKLFLYGLKIKKDAPILGKTLAEVANIDKELQYRAVAIKRDEKTIIPRGNNKFLENDLIYVVTNKEGKESVMHNAGKKDWNVEIKKVMILGGSRIGVNTARELEKKYKVKLIEIDTERCNIISNKLNKTLIINGDGRDLELLKEEGIEKVDAFIAVTENSETNILACLLAKKIGVKKTIAEVENIDYLDLAENIGIGTLINKKQITASYIYRFTINAEVKHFKCLTESAAEVLELVAKENSKITQGNLKDLNFPKDANIGSILRGNKCIIATGDTKVEAGDRVVIFMLPSAIRKVEKFFS